METSSYIDFFRKTMSLADNKRNDSLGEIGKRFNNEVLKSDYDPEERDAIITYVHKERQNSLIKSRAEKVVS